MAYTYEDAERELIDTYKCIPQNRPALMIEELFYIEKTAYRESFVHQLDARVKIIGMFAVIIAMVAIPYSPSVLTIGIIFLGFLAVLWMLAGLPWQVYAKRLIMVLPFGFFLIFFQIFFTKRYSGLPCNRNPAFQHPYLCGIC